jgi:phosphoglycerate kinase
MYSIDKLNFEGKKVLIRADFNVPLDDHALITDETRIVQSIPTIEKIIRDGGSVILMSHIGRPKGKVNVKMSLMHLLPRISQLIKQRVKFAEDCIGPEAEKMVAELEPRQVLLLENVRFHKEETDADEDFAKKLAQYGDFYIMDAFGTAHRKHASTYTIAKYFEGKRAFGYLVEDELENVNKVLNQAKRPFTAVLGGSKVSTKISIIETLMDKVDNLIIGGGLTYTFIKALGGSIGNSLVEDEHIDTALRVIEAAKEKNVKLYLPEDCFIGDSFSNDAHIGHYVADGIPDGWEGMGIGVKTIQKFHEVIQDSATILWNGPMGVFEFPHFAVGTLMIAQSVAKATINGAYSLVGGGDSVAAINQFDLGKKISYVSTGGGALLEYIEGKVLPGLEIIMEDDQ